MIRTLRVCVAAFLLLAVVLGHVSWAGESDGITGYSMRLKNKDFTTGGDGANGPGNAVVVGQNDHKDVTPSILTMQETKRRWLVSIPFRMVMFTIWIR